jgi:hypothetical protein
VLTTTFDSVWDRQTGRLTGHAAEISLLRDHYPHR